MSTSTSWVSSKQVAESNSYNHSLWAMFFMKIPYRPLWAGPLSVAPGRNPGGLQVRSCLGVGFIKNIVSYPV